MSGVLAERLQRVVGASCCVSVLLKRPFPSVVTVHLIHLPADMLVHMLRGQMKIASALRYVRFFHIDTVCAGTLQTKWHQQ